MKAKLTNKITTYDTVEEVETARLDSDVSRAAALLGSLNRGKKKRFSPAARAAAAARLAKVRPLRWPSAKTKGKDRA